MDAEWCSLGTALAIEYGWRPIEGRVARLDSNASRSCRQTAFCPEVGFRLVQKSTPPLASPSPSPTTDPGVLSSIDWKEILNGAIGNFVGTGLWVVTAGLFLSLVSKRARALYARGIKWALGWVVEIWRRLTTPSGHRTPSTEKTAEHRPVLRARSFHDRRIGNPSSEDVQSDEANAASRAAVREWATGPESAARNLDALRRTANAGNLSEIAKASRPKLPATWLVRADWEHLGIVSIENVGPGDANHVMVRSSVNEAVVRGGYWSDFPKSNSEIFKVDPKEWLIGEDFYLELTWTDERGEEQYQRIDIPAPPS